MGIDSTKDVHKVIEKQKMLHNKIYMIIDIYVTAKKTKKNLTEFWENRKGYGPLLKSQ